MSPSSPSSSSSSSNGSPRPEKLGRYEILGELGKGAMGLVYLAKDPVIGRKLAVKTFRVGFSAKDEELELFRQRFVREAQSAGILSHPNIVTIHDVLVEGDDDFFIAMEFVEGTDLKLRLQQTPEGKFSVPEAVEIAAQVADGLDYAHSKGVVHRDVKPANVILTPDRQAKITDFGIARLDTSNLTVEGQLLGTPNYMAPEQIQGKEVDHRADLFSLGVVIYEMVTGKKPFKGENLTQVSHKIAHEKQPDPREANREVPEELVQILDKALQKTPEDRYQSGADFAADLRAIYQTEGTGEIASASFLDSLEDGGLDPLGSDRVPDPVSGRIDVPEPSLPQTARSEAGGKLLWIAGGAVVLVLLVLAGYLLSSGGGGAPAEPPPIDPEQDARLQAEPLVAKGDEALERGEPTLALDFYDQALALAPGDREIRHKRDAASRQILEADSELEDRAIEDRIGRIETAIALKEWDRAVGESEELLEIDPENADAERLLREARSGERAARIARERLQGRRPTTTRSTTTSPTPPAAGAAATSTPQPSPTASSGASSAAQTGTLVIDFHTEYWKGVLTVYSSGDQLYKQDFEFEEERGRGIFRRTRKTSGSLQAERELEPTDQLKLHVYVYRDGETVSRRVDGNLPAGATRTLRIRVDEAGLLSVGLE